MANKGKKLVEAYKSFDRNQAFELPTALKMIKERASGGCKVATENARNCTRGCGFSIGGAADQVVGLSSGGHSPTRRVQLVKRRGALVGRTGPHQQRLRQSMPGELK